MFYKKVEIPRRAFQNIPMQDYGNANRLNRIYVFEIKEKEKTERLTDSQLCSQYYLLYDICAIKTNIHERYEHHVYYRPHPGAGGHVCGEHQAGRQGRASQ